MSQAFDRPQSTVSIIIPVYNVAEYLDECIESVLSQSHTDLQIILVDDGSTDASGGLCDEWAERDARVQVVHQGNGGLSAARNSGISRASGDFVMFLDSDDWLSSDCIASLTRALKKGNAAAALCGSARAYSTGAPSSEPAPEEPIVVQAAELFRNPSRFEPVHPTSACGKLFRRALLESFAFPLGRLHEDVFVTHQLLHAAGRLALDRRQLHYYRQRPGSITSAKKMSLRSAADKARAHLERSQDMTGFGLCDVAALEFRRGLAWHLRAAEIARRKPNMATGGLRDELREQESLLRAANPTIIDPKTKVLLFAYQFFPRGTLALLGRALSLSGQVSHPIEGERTRPHKTTRGGGTVRFSV